MGILTTVKVESIGVSFEEDEIQLVRYLNWEEWDNFISTLPVLQMFSKCQDAVITVDGFEMGMISDTEWGFKILNSTNGDIIEGQACDEMVSFIQDARTFTTRMGVKIEADVSTFGNRCKVEECVGVVVNSDDYIGSDPGYCIRHAWQCRHFECVGRVEDRGAVCRGAHLYACYKCDAPTIYASSPCYACEEDEDANTKV